MTGANRGIGRALTEALLTRGMGKVYATARDPEALRALRDQRLVVLRLDVTDPDQIRAAGEAASDVQLVFNNAKERSDDKHMTGTRNEWLAARLELLEAEKDLTAQQRAGAVAARPAVGPDRQSVSI